MDSDIHQRKVKMLGSRYPAVMLSDDNPQKYCQPYATWCKVQAIVTARAAEGHKETPPTAEHLTAALNPAT